MVLKLLSRRITVPIPEPPKELTAHEIELARLIEERRNIERQLAISTRNLKIMEYHGGQSSHGFKIVIGLLIVNVILNLIGWKPQQVAIGIHAAQWSALAFQIGHLAVGMYKTRRNV